MIHIVMGTCGEYSDRTVWVVGAFTDEINARQIAETKKEHDRTACVLWDAWNTEFHARAGRAGLGKTYYYYPDEKRARTAIELGMDLEPSERGIGGSEYTVISVPVDVVGEYEYDPHLA